MFVCLCICLYAPKNLTNRWTDMVLFYRVASHLIPYYFIIFMIDLPFSNIPEFNMLFNTSSYCPRGL